MKRLQVLLVLILIASGFAQCKVNPESKIYKQYKELLKQPAYRLESYEFDQNSPLISRVKTTPGFLLENLKRMDNRNDYLNYTPTEAESKTIEEVLSGLPKKYQKILKKKLKSQNISRFH